MPLDRLAEAIDEIAARSATRTGSRRARGATPATATCTRRSCSTPGDAAQRARADAAAEELFDLALRLGGTVTGEHGIGVLKNGQLPRQWAPARASRAHRAIKAALDPKGLFNPGKKEP